MLSVYADVTFNNQSLTGSYNEIDIIENKNNISFCCAFAHNLGIVITFIILI